MWYHKYKPIKCGKCMNLLGYHVFGGQPGLSMSKKIFFLPFTSECISIRYLRFNFFMTEFVFVMVKLE